MTSVTNCPICEGNTFAPFLSCIDHTVSHETFQLVKCQSCNLIITSPRPENGTLSKYYASEDYISHSNRSSTALDKIYQIARSFALKWKIKLIDDFASSSEKRLLDYGCGTGDFLNHAKNHGYKIQGVEPSSIARPQAEALTKGPIADTIHQLHGSFDIITMWHVLEHVPNLNEILQQLTARLATNGTMFIAVPNHQSYDASIYREKWAGYDVPRHLWHFSQNTMNKILSRHSLKLQSTIPMKLDAFYVSMLSEKYKRKESSISGLGQAFINGFNSNRKAASTTEYSSLIYIAKK